jgi:hypothetical protein
MNAIPPVLHEKLAILQQLLPDELDLIMSGIHLAFIDG